MSASRLTRARLRAELARRHFGDFAAAVQPATLESGAFHGAYYRILEHFARGDIRRLIVSMPPQHGKSLGASIMLPAFLLGLNPDLRIAVASYNAALASRFNRRVQRLIESPEYAAVFPATRIKGAAGRSGSVRTASEVEIVGREGSLVTVGREGTLTGRPVDIFILDDLYKDAMEANSPVVRDNCWEWYTSVVKSRLHNASQELVVFTRWHEDDLIGRIATKTPVEELTSWSQLVPGGRTGGWLHLRLEAVKESPPSEIDPRAPDEALWPARHSTELLDEKRRLDPQTFNALYQGRPSSKEGLLYGESIVTYTSLPAEIVKRGNYTDTADAGGDYLCSVCYAVGADGKIYVTDVVYSGEGMEVTEKLVAEMLVCSGTRAALIESNNGGRGFARALARLAPGVRIEWFHQGANKEARILSNSAAVAHNIRMPEDWARRWEEFHRHVTTYRRTLHANRLHDAPDVLTGIVETELPASGAGRIRRVRFAN